MSKRARSTRGQSSSSQGVSIEEKVRMLGVFESGVHQMRHDALARRRIHSRDIIDWDFLSNQGLAQAFFEYDPNHLGVRFRLEGEQQEIYLLELGWRIGLYSERQSRESAPLRALSVEPSPHVFKKKSLISIRVVMELHNVGCFWPASREAVEEDEKDDEGDEATGGGAGHEGARGSANMYRNMSQGDWQVRQSCWMDQQDEQWGRINIWMGQQNERAHWMYDHTVRQF
ncbi:hypothetical protein Tco_0517833 [Tanacetum coccineum]